MLVRLELSLPRDARFVGVLRNVAQCMLRDLNAPEEAIDDIQLALGEACNNAVKHAVGSQEYSVALAIGGDGCEIEVADLGPGFVPPDEPPALADPTSEAGRGILLMDALVDDLEFVSQHGDQDGTCVRLTKRWDDLGFTIDGQSALPQRDPAR